MGSVIRRQLIAGRRRGKEKREDKNRL